MTTCWSRYGNNIMHLATPYLLTDAQIAIFPAWQDGLPKRGPAPARHAVEPLFQCVASISWQTSYVRHAASFGSLSSSAHGSALVESYQVSVAFPEGVVNDGIGRSSRLVKGDKYIIVAIMNDQESGEWQRFQFFHVTANSDSLDFPQEVMSRAMQFTAAHLDQDGGDGIAPAITPKVYGYVDWHSGSMRLPVLRFDEETGIWETTGLENTGLENQPYAMWDAPDVPLVEPDQYTFSLFQPRTQESLTIARKLDVLWEQRLFFSIASDGLPAKMLISGMGAGFESGNGLYSVSGTQLGYPKYILGSSWTLAVTNVSGVNRWAILEGVGFTTLRYYATVAPAASPEGLIYHRSTTPGVPPYPVVAKIESLHNELILHAGIGMECNGSPEPIEKFIQDHYLEESYTTFRCLDRIYMTVGHDLVAVPRISTSPAPLSHGFRFLLGDTVMDQSGWWGLANAVPFVTSPSDLTTS
jgi:hypothetical protein